MGGSHGTSSAPRLERAADNRELAIPSRRCNGRLPTDAEHEEARLRRRHAIVPHAVPFEERPPPAQARRRAPHSAARSPPQAATTDPGFHAVMNAHSLTVCVWRSRRSRRGFHPMRNRNGILQRHHVALFAGTPPTAPARTPRECRRREGPRSRAGCSSSSLCQAVFAGGFTLRYLPSFAARRSSTYRAHAAGRGGVSARGVLIPHGTHVRLQLVNDRAVLVGRQLDGRPHDPTPGASNRERIDVASPHRAPQGCRHLLIRLDHCQVEGAPADDWRAALLPHQPVERCTERVHGQPGQRHPGAREPRVENDLMELAPAPLVRHDPEQDRVGGGSLVPAGRSRPCEAFEIEIDGQRRSALHVSVIGRRPQRRTETEI